MPRRARLRAASALLAAAALVLAVPSVALADGPGPAPTPTGSASPERSAEARRLGAEIVALQREAETKGKAAQKAGERAHDARADAKAARLALEDANAAADAAAQTARTSKARASAVAARLARVDAGTLPLSLMLNARSAGGVLNGLSSASQLSVQSQLLYTQAKRDQQEAERLQDVAERRSGDATAASARAARAYAAAKRAAAGAERDVASALARQRALLRELATEGVDGCEDVGDTPVEACLPAEGAGDDVQVRGHSLGAQVLRYAARQIGKPYVFGADGPESYDCSGLTLAAYASAGVSIGIHSATAQYRLARDKGDLVSVAQARPGDLLFYTDGGGDMYHVTIYAGGGLMIEAPYPGATVREAPVRSGDLLPLAAHFG